MTDTTDIAALPPAARAVIVLNSSKTEFDLRAMVSEAETITEVNDKTSREQAHRVGMKLKTARTTIAKTGKAARDDATAFCKAVIAEEGRLIAITENEEKRVIGLRDAFDEKLEAERRAEEAKRAEIMAKIDGIRRLPVELAGATADEIMAEYGALVAFTPTFEVFGDLSADCKIALEETCSALCDLHARVLAKETAAAALEAQRRQVEEALAAERAALEALRLAAAVQTGTASEQETATMCQTCLTLSDSAHRARYCNGKGDCQASAEFAAPAGAESEPVAVTMATTEDDAPTAIEPEPVDLGAVGEPAVPTDWRIRNFALHTAAQFGALAAKVSQCGFPVFAGELSQVATFLRNGLHDEALAQADHEALIAADNLLLDATVEAIDALREEEKVAA